MFRQDRAKGLQRNKAGVFWHPDWLGEQPSLYHPERWQKAENIKVKELRQIWLWPLVLRLKGLGHAPNPDGVIRQSLDTTRKALKNSTLDAAIEAAQSLDTTREALKNSPWKAVPDLLDHLPEEPVAGTDAATATLQRDAFQYAEFVYFFDYLQSILYGDNSTKKNCMLELELYRRQDVKKVGIRLPGRTEEVIGSVERCNLYLLSTGTAVLAVEAKFSDLQLNEAQDLIDYARRIYAPYFKVEGPDKIAPGKFPETFRWIGEAGCNLFKGVSERACLGEARDFIRRKDGAELRSAPVMPQWRALIAPLVLQGYEGDAKPSVENPVWRNVVDERLPTMSYLSLTDAHKSFSDDFRLPDYPSWPASEPGAASGAADMWAVSRGDWVRLCYADDKGAAAYPYDAGFLSGFEKECCYDRFWPSPSHTSSTRIMFAGYHTVFVGSGWFFDFHILQHFRRHYFQMVLLANVELVSLLATSSRLSNAVEELHREENGGESGRGEECCGSTKPRRKESGASGKLRRAQARRHFTRSVMQIQEDFLDFVHLFRFTGVSNQIQARELFEKLRTSMGLKQLYEEVKDELSSSVAYGMSRAQVDQSEAGLNLSIIAAIGFPISLILSFFGMNIMTRSEVFSAMVGFLMNVGHKASVPGCEGAAGKVIALPEFAVEAGVFLIGFAVLMKLGTWLMLQILKHPDVGGQESQELNETQTLVKKYSDRIFWCSLFAGGMALAFGGLAGFSLVPAEDLVAPLKCDAYLKHHTLDCVHHHLSCLK